MLTDVDDRRATGKHSKPEPGMEAGHEQNVKYFVINAF